MNAKKTCLSILFLFFVPNAWNRTTDAAKPIPALHTYIPFEANAQVGLASRYFSEGRDALDGTALWTGSSEIGYGPFSIGFWYGISDDRQYDERQYSFVWSEEREDFDVRVSFTLIDFGKTGTSDEEWLGGFLYRDLPFGAETELTLYYSNFSKGTFLEWSASKEFEINEKIQILPSSVLGWNQGYVSDGSKGFNFIAIRLDYQYFISQYISVVGFGNQSWAMEKSPKLPDDLLLKDFFFYGFGIEWKL